MQSSTLQKTNFCEPSGRWIAKCWQVCVWLNCHNSPRNIHAFYEQRFFSTQPQCCLNFSLRPKYVLKTSSKNVLTSSRSPHMVLYVIQRDASAAVLLPWDVLQDVNLTIIHKLSFYWFFSIFSDSSCISDIALPKLVKNLIRHILVLLWSGCFIQNRNIRGRPQDVVCRLGNFCKPSGRSIAKCVWLNCHVTAHVRYTLFYKQRFFQLSLSVA